MAGDADARLMYELSKLTNVSRQLSDDFVEAMTYTIFRELVVSMPDPSAFLDIFMDTWEESIILQKKIEIDTLTKQEGSMLDMAAGALIANGEDIEKFKEEVAEMKQILRVAVSGGIENV